MKTLSTITMAFLLNVIAFAGTNPAIDTESQVALVKTYNKVKLFYESNEVNTVKVRILKESGKLLGEFKILKTDGFIKPFSMAGLPDGIYIFEIEDKSGVVIEKINYKKDEQSRLKTSIYKLADKEKYSLQVVSKTKKPVNVLLLDDKGNVLHEEEYNKSFTRVFDLSKLNGPVTFKIKSDIFTQYQFTRD